MVYVENSVQYSMHNDLSCNKVSLSDCICIALDLALECILSGLA